MIYVPSRFYIPGKRKFIEGELDLRCALSAKYKIQVLRAGRGYVIEEPFGDRWIPNLLTNYGFDQMFNSLSMYQLVASVCKAGTSTTTPANTDTALGAYWATSNTATGSGGGSVNDTTNGACAQTASYDFAAAGSAVGLNEIGMGSGTGNGSNLYTHSLFPSQVNLNAGDVLRVAYTVNCSIPATVTPVTVSLSAINGFNISGSMKVVGTFQTIFGTIAANNGVTGGNDSYLRNVYNNASNYLCSAPTTFPPVNTAPSTITVLGTSVTGTPASYTAGSFSRNQTFVWSPSNPTSTASNVNAIWLNAQGGYGSGSSGLLLILTAAQTKANTNTLTIVTNCTMARA